MLPLGILVAGFLFMLYDQSTATGYAGMAGGIVFLASIVLALGIVVGHYL